MTIQEKYKKLKNWQKGAIFGLVCSAVFILLNSLTLLSSQTVAELKSQNLSIGGYFAIMIVFYAPFFVVIGMVIGAIIKKKKPIIYSAALVIYNEDRSKYLLVKRPEGDDSMPGYWGFPAASKRDPSEAWEQTARRAAKIKLGVEIEIVKDLGEDTIDRGAYVLILRDYEVKVTSGKPCVPQNFVGVTQYAEQKWTDETDELKKAARDGSLCSRVFLRANKIDW